MKTEKNSPGTLVLGKSSDEPISMKLSPHPTANEIKGITSRIAAATPNTKITLELAANIDSYESYQKHEMAVQPLLKYINQRDKLWLYSVVCSSKCHRELSRVGYLWKSFFDEPLFFYRGDFQRYGLNNGYSIRINNQALESETRTSHEILKYLRIDMNGAKHDEFVEHLKYCNYEVVWDDGYHSVYLPVASIMSIGIIT